MTVEKTPHIVTFPYVKLLLLLLAVLCSLACQHAKDHKVIKWNDENISLSGRYLDQGGHLQAGWPGFTIRFRTTSKQTSLKLGTIATVNPSPVCYVKLFVNDHETKRIKITSEVEIIDLSEYLNSDTQEVRLVKITESMTGDLLFYEAQSPSKPIQSRAIHSKAIQFVGNSLTCGYGNLGEHASCSFSPDTEDYTKTYAYLTASHFNFRQSAIAYSGKGVIENYDHNTHLVMPELYSRAVPHSPDKWSSTSDPSIIAINLGTNDFSLENPDSARFVNGYCRFVEDILQRHPTSTILLLHGIALSDDYPKGHMARTQHRSCVRAVYQALKEKNIAIEIAELSAQGTLGYGCNHHPNVAQHKKNADELIRILHQKYNL
jgi:hypothetical protein